MENNKLLFFVHEDIETIREFIPIAYYNENDKYIMQEDRIVFYGKVEDCTRFMDNNKDKYRKECTTFKSHKTFAYERWRDK